MLVYMYYVCTHTYATHGQEKEKSPSAPLHHHQIKKKASSIPSQTPPRTSPLSPPWLARVLLSPSCTTPQGLLECQLFCSFEMEIPLLLCLLSLIFFSLEAGCGLDGSAQWLGSEELAQLFPLGTGGGTEYGLRLSLWILRGDWR